MSKENPTIGDNIRRHRTKKEFSQEKLARLADVSLPTITKLESGETPNPTIDTIRKIANALETSIDELIK